MTIRKGMLRAAGKATSLLGDSTETVIRFAYEKMNPDGGFKGRNKQSDLYYTVFGVEILLALKADIPHKQIFEYLRSFDVEKLDLVHLASLVRCHVNLIEFAGTDLIASLKERIFQQLNKFKSEDGGFNTAADSECGNVYGCFLALGVFQDIEEILDNEEAVINCIQSSRQEDGSYANEKILTAGTTPATAAAVVLLKYLGQKPSQNSLDWLLSSSHPRGGFAAIQTNEQNNIPDLLSTATALHALSLNNVSFDNIKEKCLDYLDELWSSDGGFTGNWFDADLDCEYTYYGLLSLGHLSE